MSLGQALVAFAAGGMILGLLYAGLRYDLYNHRDTPSLKDMGDALKRGKPISSPWKRVDDKNSAGYGILAACFLGLAVLMFTHNWLINLIDQF